MSVARLRHAALRALLACGLAGGAAPAFAHAYLERAEPPPFSALDKAPAQLRFRYSEPIEPEFVEISVSCDGKPIDTDKPTIDKDGRTVRVKLGPAQAGEYVVRWRLVSKDGHRTQGVVEFKVRGR
jgi:methionine-rich copper-binding protein CopC